MMKQALTVAAALWLSAPMAFAATDKAKILDTYADIAQAGYEDSLTIARDLDAAIDALIANPSEETMKAAREAWIAARVPYMQTEVYRFGNPIVDDWEGKVNAWPLDEGLIDYVDASTAGPSPENPARTANVIANEAITMNGETIDTSEITAELLEGSLQELGGIEANVATGYHAVEFLLWGQDLNGTGAGAGERSWTDYAKGDDCTNGHCDRRAEYLATASALLVSDLEWMAAQWDEDGAARAALTGDGEDSGIARILTGIGSLSYGELAGERMQLGLLLHDPEEEHDCFSDNTFDSHYYDAKGMMNVYEGRYVRTDGSVVEGPSVSDLVAEENAELDASMTERLKATEEAMTALKSRGENVEAYDQMIGEGGRERHGAGRDRFPQGADAHA